jgi:hypothetical protein
MPTAADFYCNLNNTIFTPYNLSKLRTGTYRFDAYGFLTQTGTAAQTIDAVNLAIARNGGKAYYWENRNYTYYDEEVKKYGPMVTSRKVYVMPDVQGSGANAIPLTLTAGLSELAEVGLSVLTEVGLSVLTKASVFLSVLTLKGDTRIDKNKGNSNYPGPWSTTKPDPTGNVPFNNPPQGFDPENPPNWGGALKWGLIGFGAYRIYDEYTNHMNNLSPIPSLIYNTSVTPQLSPLKR